MPQEKRCLFCMQAFTPKNPKALFCSTKHRVAYFRHLKKLNQKAMMDVLASKPKEDLADIAELSHFQEALK